MMSTPVVAATWRVVEAVDIDDVPSWFPVEFSLLTHGGKHFVAYYSAEHEMTVAECKVGENKWRKQTLPSKVGWDSHNYVTLAVDVNGQIHLAGNMHGHPLIYFRTTTPGDITTLTPAAMTGRDERRCTYPVFFTDAEANLLFIYRDGGSGDGSSIVNRYDAETQKWTRFLAEPLFDGEGQRNSYPLGPVQGSDGLIHLVWVWRDTPDCATNHHLSYVRSRDLKNWETAAGEPVELPLRLGLENTWVDPIPSGGGIINGCQKLFIDSGQRPIVSYHKSDADGNMQVYVARFVNGAWHPHAVTSWQKPVEFSGFGSMPFIGIEISGLRRLDAKHLYLDYRHRDYDEGQIELDEEALAPTTEHPQIETDFPTDLNLIAMEPESDWPGMQVHVADDKATAPDARQKYVLRWETLETNQDRPREPPLPPPSRLRLVVLERG